MKKIDSIQNYIKYWLIAFFLLPFFFWWFSHAADDLLWELFAPTKYKDTIIDMGDNVDTAWKKFIKWWTDVISGKNSPSIIIKVTRLLLILTTTLSITMILYNWLIYIIQTGQGKEWKSLVKNVMFIIIGILVALFSVVIINLIQSIPTTIDKELIEEPQNKTDNKALKWEDIGWGDTNIEWNDIRSRLWNTKDGNKEKSEDEIKAEITNQALEYFTDTRAPYTGTDENWNEIWLVRLEDDREVEIIQAFLDEKL